MYIQRLPLASAAGHLLLHNVVDEAGKRVLRKGVRLGQAQLTQLQSLGWQEVEVAVLQADDVWEDEAASQLAAALQSESLDVAWGVGGRANFHTTVSGVFVVDIERLRAINLFPGLALATLPQFSVVHPRFATENQTNRQGDQVATLKVIPYALPLAVVKEALAIAAAAPILTVRPLRFHRVALLLIGDPSSQRRMQMQFEPPIRTRIEQLGSALETIAFVEQDEALINATVASLIADHDALIVAGQTSIMDMDDLTLRALRSAGVRDLVHGAPVDPGNLLAFGFIDEKVVLCAPGCARSPKRNVVDLVLPRLLTGERISRQQIVDMALGGLLFE